MGFVKATAFVKWDDDRAISDADIYDLAMLIIGVEIIDKPSSVSLLLKGRGSGNVFDFIYAGPFPSDHAFRLDTFIYQHKHIATFDIGLNHFPLLVGQKKQIKTVAFILS